MTQQEIIEANKLLANFIAGKETPLGEFDVYGIIPCIEDGEYEKHFFTPSEMEFSSSWDWIMKVVEEIDDLGFVVTIRSCGYTQIDGEKLPFIIEEDGGDSIESTYFACVDFVKWWVEKT